MPSSSSMFISSWIAACSEVGAMELGAPPAGPGACSGPEVSGDLQYLEVELARPWEGGGNLQQGAGLGMTRWGICWPRTMRGICWPRKMGRMEGGLLGEMGGDGGGGGVSGGGDHQPALSNNFKDWVKRLPGETKNLFKVVECWS
nr:uncharacterized protein LOC120975737 [Aegilops tauschii subsp. strangulata]